MKPTQTLVEAQNQLFASIRSLAKQMTYHAYPTHCNSGKDVLAKAQQNFLNAVRGYAETLVYDAYSRYDSDEEAFFTRAAYEELMEALADDDVIPMEEIAEALGIKKTL